MRRIIFLDMDGVMNGFLRWPVNAGRLWIDPDAVSRLNRIVAETRADVVISSTWRRYRNVESLLVTAGFIGNVIGITPYIPKAPRGDEIAAWLHTAPIDQFVILDDDSDMGSLSSLLVRTEFAVGLEDHHVDEAIRLLQ